MKIIISGATGMIGSALVQALKPSHVLTVVGRDLKKLRSVFGDDLQVMTWDQLNRETLAENEIVINLAGENIGSKKWSESQKEKILKSRVDTTQLLANLCAELGEKSPCLINASAVSIYGFQPTKAMQATVVYDEDSKIVNAPDELLSRVAIAWEDALSPAKSAGVRVINLRFAVVLSQKGGALAKMLPSFRMGLGAVIGSGSQPFCWVALSDVVRAIQFLIDQSDASGPYNIVADQIYTQEAFANCLAKRLNKPRFLRLPEMLIHLLFGQMGDETLLKGQSVKAKRLQDLGFRFKISDPSECI